MAERVSAAYQPGIGRPSELGDVEKLQIFLAALAEGHYPSTACSLADISRTTLFNWQKKAEEGNIAAQAFVNALEKARAFSIDRGLRQINAAAEKPQNWCAAAWRLERTQPEMFALRKEDTSVAKVIVQIGARDSDVTVNVQQIASEPDNQSLSLVPRNELAG